jgi:hypothetical protein
MKGHQTVSYMAAYIFHYDLMAVLARNTWFQRISFSL